MSGARAWLVFQCWRLAMALGRAEVLQRAELLALGALIRACDVAIATAPVWVFVLLLELAFALQRCAQ